MLLKPNKSAFIITRIIPQVTVSVILITGLAVFLKIVFPDSSAFLNIFLLLIPLFGIFLFLQSIIYKKRGYTLEDTKFIQQSGTLFSDHETELIVKNITHVKMSLPWLQYKLFRTGNIRIEAAGSQESEIYLDAMDNTHEIHEHIKTVMQKNGFDLQEGEPIQTERPNTLGVFFEVFKTFITSIAFIIYFIGGFFEEEEEQALEFLITHLGAIIPIVGIIVLLLIIWQIFNFLDLKRRVYKIYKNTITYTEGFLSKNYAFIPYKNLSDASTTQTLIDKIFTLYDVKISCQGSGNEILFKNLRNGQAISDALDTLMNKHRSAEVTESPHLEQSAHQPRQVVKQKKEEPRPTATSYTSAFKIHKARALFPVWVFGGLAIIIGIITAPLIFSSSDVIASSASINETFETLVWFIGMIIVLSIGTIIRIFATSYQVKEQSIIEKFEFLSTRVVEFANDKLTGVVIHQNIIDKFFRTMTINFWSIGASRAIVFRHVRITAQDYEELLKKYRIINEKENYRLQARFTISEMMRADLLASVLIAAFLLIIAILLYAFLPKFATGILIAILVILALLTVPWILYKKYYFQNTYASFTPSHVYYQQGLWFKSFYYARYEHIKDITTTKYPFSSQGRIRFNVAGERVGTTQAGHLTLGKHQQKNITSNSFTINFVEHIKLQDEIIDIILDRQPDKAEMGFIQEIIEKGHPPKILLTAKPALVNALFAPSVILAIADFWYIIITIDLKQTAAYLLLLFINIVIIALIVINNQVKSFTIENYRVLGRSGIFYKKQTSIIFDRIDFINKHQKFLNKLFKNATITVNTVGSSSPELRVTNITNYQEFYNKVKEYYEQN